jgi:hypothetical protein
MFIQPKFWYSQVFDSLGREVYHYDLNLLGDPGYDFLSHFPVVIWYTGLQNELTLTPENQEALSQYLVNGGNLFLSGQNITEDLLNSPFLSDYLHVKQLNGTYSGQDTLVGKTGDPIGDNLLLTLNQGWDALFQSSMSELQPVNGGEMVFNYYSSFSCAAVRSMSPVYKTVFFGFGFEGINGFKNRLEVMDRILEYFEGTVGTDDGNDFMCKPDQTISFINPVSVSQSLQYVLSTSGDVCICFYDLQGRIMHVFEEGYQPAGTHHLDPFKSQIVPGIYIYRMQGGAVEQTGKIVVFP